MYDDAKILIIIDDNGKMINKKRTKHMLQRLAMAHGRSCHGLVGKRQI